MAPRQHAEKKYVDPPENVRRAAILVGMTPEEFTKSGLDADAVVEHGGHTEPSTKGNTFVGK